MSLQRQLTRLRGIYDEYPRQFWVLVLGTFIDRLGGALVLPFFTLYVTRKFDVGMTEAGLLIGVFSLTSIVGSLFGGALADRLGRKVMLLFGLVVSAFTSLLMGLVNVIALFFAIVVFVGLFAEVGGPAQQAMVADLLPEEKRTQGFGVLRVVVNLAITIGPTLGGLLASQSFMLLFIGDAVTSLVTAGIVYLALRETRPASREDEAEHTIAQTFSGYVDVVRDGTFVAFLGATMLMVLVYIQMHTTLAVYLRDSHGISTRGFGYLLSLNAAMVVLFQFPITRWITKYRALMVRATGTLLYAIGFSLYGFVSTYALFILSIVIITVGEMFTAPVGQAIVARLAPEDMRGRYMAVFGFGWVIPTAGGTLLAGLVMDNTDPRWVWYGAGIIGLIAAGAFALMGQWVERSTWAVVDKRLDILHTLEERRISAQEAAKLLEAAKAGRLTRLAASHQAADRQHLRVRVIELTSDTTKVDLRLPMALVNTVLRTGGRLAADLEGLEMDKLEKLIASSAANESVETLETEDGERVEISVEVAREHQ
jgi:MFS family permease